MRKELVIKALVLGVICLFVGVGIQPAIAIEPKLSSNNIEKEEDCDCQEIDGENDSICWILLIKHFMRSIRANFWWLIWSELPSGGILSQIVWIYYQYLDGLTDDTLRLAKSYDCFWT